MLEELVFATKIIRFCSDGLTKEQADVVRDITCETITGAQRRFAHALARCTFFADPGYDALVAALSSKEGTENPRIEGNDSNPFDQHYWVAFDLRTQDSSRTVLIDPIFRYVGLEQYAPVILDGDHAVYYQRKRIVQPDTPVANGGVRIKTIGI